MISNRRLNRAQLVARRRRIAIHNKLMRTDADYRRVVYQDAGLDTIKSIGLALVQLSVALGVIGRGLTGAVSAIDSTKKGFEQTGKMLNETGSKLKEALKSFGSIVKEFFKAKLKFTVKIKTGESPDAAN